MKKRKRGAYLLMMALSMFLFVSCVSAESDSAGTIDDAGGVTSISETLDDSGRPVGWSEETHSNSADPNYEVVFPDDQVNTMTIIIDPEDWEAMLDEMTTLYGPQGDSALPGQAPAGGRPAGGPPAGGGMPGGGMPGGGPVTGGPPIASPADIDLESENPMWVAATIQFEGDVWTQVGVRFKGNSSLMSSWSSGSLELPFKLDFDEFEDENPAIKNQRFYGFKQLSLSNNTGDSTFMRDTVASDVMAAAEIISAETGFYNLYVDYGEGVVVDFGLYTMIEVVDDTVIERVLGSDDGNIYEADGPAASFATGTFDDISASFEKENNEEEADWSDIEALYAALHSDARQSDPDAWREELESVFDVDTFLHWLAVNTVMENWDTYGAMTHNYYLYNNPDTGLMTWIPWDHNEALNEGKRSSMTLDMSRIGDRWPLIRYLLDDGEYHDTYVNYVAETAFGVFDADAMVATYNQIADLIEPYATEDIGAAAFERAVQELIDHTYDRVAEAERFLGM